MVISIGLAVPLKHGKNNLKLENNSCFKLWLWHNTTMKTKGNFKMSSNVIFLLSFGYGLYIPQEFVNNINSDGRWGEFDTPAIKEGAPYSDNYWEEWDEVLSYAKLTIDGVEYTLHHDGDLFAVAIDKMTDEEKLNLFGEI